MNLIGWISKNIQALKDLNIIIGDKNNIDNITEPLYKANDLTLETAPPLLTYQIKLDKDIRNCTDASKCFLREAVETKKFGIMEFSNDDVAEKRVEIVSFYPLKEGASSCERCFYKYRVAEFLKRLNTAELKFMTKPTNQVTDIECSLIGLKMNTDKYRKMMVLGVKLTNSALPVSYLIQQTGALLRIAKERREGASSSRNAYKITTLENLPLTKDFEFEVFDLNDIQIFDERQGWTSLLRNHYQDYSKKYKDAFPEDIDLLKMRDRVDRDPRKRKKVKSLTIDLESLMKKLEDPDAKSSKKSHDSNENSGLRVKIWVIVGTVILGVIVIKVLMGGDFRTAPETVHDE